jgi:hypothetical protein
MLTSDEMMYATMHLSMEPMRLERWTEVQCSAPNTGPCTFA